MSSYNRLCLLTTTIISLHAATTTTTAAAAAAAASAATIAVKTINDEYGGGIESSFRAVYSNYKQCEADPHIDTVSCLKLKALKLVDRALSINNIPIIEGISLAKREDNQRSLGGDQWTVAATAASNNAIDNDESAATAAISSLPMEPNERNEKLNNLLWRKVAQFVESRSLQFKVSKLIFGSGNDDYDYDFDYDENATDDQQQSAKFQDEHANTTNDVRTATARGKKDKNKGMYMYMMMMKGGMMALAYKGLALLAGKALLVSKIALTLALLVAIKKLFSGGHHSQKTTYEIVKTPIITHSHQYGGGGGGGPAGPANAQNGHYAAADFTGYDGAPYARSLDEPLLQQQQQQQQRQRITLKAVDAVEIDSRYTTARTVASAQARSLARQQLLDDRDGAAPTDGDDSMTLANQHHQQFNVPYAHLAAYRRQLIDKPTSKSSSSSLTKTDANANVDPDVATHNSTK